LLLLWLSPRRSKRRPTEAVSSLSPHPHACFFLAAALLLLPLSGNAQPVEQKLTASDGSDADRFGVSVSVSGDVAFAGARGDNDTVP